jgi:hypothetical protein
MSRRLPATILCLLAPVAAGCGDARTRPPDASVAAAPHRVHTLSFPFAGLRLRAPSNWTLQQGRAPLVAAVWSGRAMIAIWRYPRTEPLPADTAALKQARDELVRVTRERDRHLHLIRVRLLAFHGARAIELAALERVRGRLRRVRSLHVYEYGAEIVLDAYAPPSDFHAVDHEVFAPLGRSLRITRAARR